MGPKSELNIRLAKVAKWTFYGAEVGYTQLASDSQYDANYSCWVNN